MFWAKVRDLFTVRGDNPDLVRAQIAALSTQVPMLYVILIVNSLAISVTHFGLAPTWLTTGLPLVLFAVCIFRTAGWRRLRAAGEPHGQAVRRLRSTVFFAGLLGASFTVWGAALFPYGDIYRQAHLAFFMSITVIVCVFCLMQLRAAALVLTFTALVPTIVFFAQTAQPVMFAIAMNLGLVTLAMMRILFTQYANFLSLIEIQQQLIVRQRETQQLSDQNYRLANLDTLTDLPNRRSFFQEFDALMKMSAQGGKSFAVALIDLDGFKAINDLHGHAAGDRLLIETAQRLQSIMRPGLILARLGGDEFAVLAEGIVQSELVGKLGEKICEALRLTFALNNIMVSISGSVGFAVYPQAGETKEELLEHADYALMHAKQKRRGSAVLFTQQHETEIRLFNRIDQALRQADLSVEVDIVLQPIIDTSTGEILHYEALSRWNSPQLGSVAASDFIRAAERSELINRITLSVLKKTLRQMAFWPADVQISFNLSARDISSPETILKIIAMISESGINPHRLMFEVTETAVMADFNQAIETLRMLRHYGIKVALDDFGSGYSSLGYVHRLPLDVIKIDRVFVSDIETKAPSRSIVKTIANLCENLQLDCVVEGVETEGQVKALRELGCTIMQGYFFAKPTSPNKIWADGNIIERYRISN
jgi:diguanylate cyclase (GGDEF)-like protein